MIATRHVTTGHVVVVIPEVVGVVDVLAAFILVSGAIVEIRSLRRRVGA